MRGSQRRVLVGTHRGVKAPRLFETPVGKLLMRILDHFTLARV
jgi:hypothetical protein